MFAVHDSRDVAFLHEHDFRSHVAEIGLQQFGFGVARRHQTGPVIKDAPVATVAHVPCRFAGTLWLAVNLVVGRKIAVEIHPGGKDDVLVLFKDGFLKRGEVAVGERDIGRHELFGITARN